MPKKIISLDGLRAISITMVLLAHTSKLYSSGFRNSIIWTVIANSNTGVRIFFVISGYLITKLLLEEKRKSGSNNLQHFYMRRMLRIFPIYYLYILVILGIKLFINDSVAKNSDFLYAATYLWNYKHIFQSAGVDSLYFGHFWSLAMEEQFYLLWPLAFTRIKHPALIKIVCCCLLLMPVLRIAFYFITPGSRGQLSMMLHTGADSILIGCLGAFLQSNKELYEKCLFYIKKPYVIYPAIIFLFLISPVLSDRFGGTYHLSLGISLNNLCILIFMFWSINTETGFSKLLNSKPVVQIGILSYSIYIWHLLVVRNFDLWPVNYLLIVSLGVISYYLIEKPILRLKTKFQPKY